MISVSDNVAKLFGDKRPLVALNLMSLSMQKRRDLNSDNLIYWVDGIFGSVCCKFNRVGARRIVGRALLVEFADFVRKQRHPPKIVLLGGPVKINKIEKLFEGNLARVTLPYFTVEEVSNLDISPVKSFDFALVAVSSPKQELLAKRLYEEFGTKCLCFGGAINMIQGEESAAPKLVSRLGLEAIYRLKNDTFRRVRRLLLSLGPGCLNLFSTKIEHKPE